MTFLQRFVVGDGNHELLEFIQIFATLLDSFDIFFELRGLKNRPHASQLSNSFSVVSNRSRFRPFLESSKALIVTSFGIETSNGSPFRKATWVEKHPDRLRRAQAKALEYPLSLFLDFRLNPTVNDCGLLDGNVLHVHTLSSFFDCAHQHPTTPPQAVAFLRSIR
jgi:hypothetical protein